jgi:acyl-CoA oxidase
MQANRLQSLLDDPDLQPLLPVLYIAWADVHLAKEESTRIRDLAASLQGVDGNSSEVLEMWLDADAPPTATELSRIRRRIREHGDGIHSSLADLSASMKDSLDEGSRRALEEYEQSGEIHGVGVSADIFRAGSIGVLQGFQESPPSFDPEKLTELLDGDYRDAWEEVRELLASDAFVYSDAETKNEQRDDVFSWLGKLAEQGFGACAIPEEYGGEDNMPRFIHIFEALAMFDLSLVVKFGVQFGLFGGSILFLGTEKHHSKYLADIASLKLLGGFAMTESGHGSNVREIETTAKFDPDADEFVINSPSMSSRKEWIGNAARDGEMMTVFAQLETGGDSYGVHAFLVPIRDNEGEPLRGIRIEDCGHKMGLNGVDNGRIYFDQVRIPRENLLDRYASVAADGSYESPIANDNKRFFTMLGTLVGGRISVAAAALTAAKKTLAIALRYGALRRQFGGADGAEKRILDYRTHQLRLFPLLARSYGLHFVTEDLISQYKERTEETTRDVETLAAGVKSIATWHAIDASQMARECCGGLGFLTENQIATVRRDVDVFATFEGDNTVLMQLLAKNKLTSYAKGFEQDLVMTVVKELSRRAKSELLEANPVIVRKTDEEHLRSAEFHCEITRLRAHNLLVSAARRIRRRMERGVEAFAAFNDIQDHLMAYAHAEMNQQVVCTFADAVDAMEEGPEKEAMERLRQLDALHTIYENAGWYLENGYIQPEKSRAIRKLRLKLLDEIRPDILGFVDGFGIPDECLSAPIAFEDYIGREPEGSEA